MYKGIALVKSSSLVKITAAFVVGVVVSLGSALIVVRMTDTPHAPLTVPATAPVASDPAELPKTALNTSQQPALTDTEPSKPKPERAGVPVLTKKVVRQTAPETHRSTIYVAPPKPVKKPVQIAQNLPPSAPPDAAPASIEATVPQEQTADDQTAPPTPQPQAAYEPPPAPQPHVVTLAAGTVLSIRLGEKLSTDHNYTGDTFRATLLTPVIRDGFIIADKGSKVLGRVVSAQPAGHTATEAALTLALTEINTTDGQRVAVSTDTYSRKGASNVGEDTAKIAGGAALGAIIGAVAGGGKGAAIGAGAGGAAGTGAVLLTHGRPAVIDNETQITFKLANPVTITEKLN